MVVAPCHGLTPNPVREAGEQEGKGGAEGWARADPKAGAGSEEMRVEIKTEFFGGVPL